MCENTKAAVEEAFLALSTSTDAVLEALETVIDSPHSCSRLKIQIARLFGRVLKAHNNVYAALKFASLAIVDKVDDLNKCIEANAVTNAKSKELTDKVKALVLTHKEDDPHRGPDWGAVFGDTLK